MVSSSRVGVPIWIDVVQCGGYSSLFLFWFIGFFKPMPTSINSVPYLVANMAWWTGVIVVGEVASLSTITLV
jgi:hypothetical protein